MKSEMFQKALIKYFNKYNNHPQYEFWIKDHLFKVGIPDNTLLNYIQNVVKYIHKTYFPNLKKQDIKILDLGCGMGEFATFLSLLGYGVIGVDIDLEQLKIAQILKLENKANVQFLKADATRLPFKDGKFNIDVFEHIEDLDPICVEMYRVLKENGVIFLRFPNKLKGYEDHVGLPLLPLLPERLFQIVFKKITQSRRYYQEGLYVYYRRFSEVYKILRKKGFYVKQLPENLMYPRLPGVYRIIYKIMAKLARLSNNNYLPVVTPYYHLIITKNPIDSLQDLDVKKIKLFEFTWWIVVWISSVISILRSIISKKLKVR